LTLTGPSPEPKAVTMTNEPPAKPEPVTVTSVPGQPEVGERKIEGLGWAAIIALVCDRARTITAATTITRSRRTLMGKPPLFLKSKYLQKQHTDSIIKRVDFSARGSIDS
jgi:hypothetical protein